MHASASLTVGGEKKGGPGEGGRGEDGTQGEVPGTRGGGAGRGS